MYRHRRFLLSLILLAAGAPMLLAQQVAAPQPAAAPRRLLSWTSDRREYAVGDVITVVVSEATLASATKEQDGSDQQTRKNDLGIDPPQSGTKVTPSIDATMSFDKNSASQQSGNASRGVNFTGNISVRVVAVDKTGLLQVKGVKTVDVDKNKQTLNFAGWVRPEDVSPQNFIRSERVADAQLTYALSGDIGKTRGGILGRLVSVFWP
jgi:flagellar L-ring protein precursor FlgH